MNDPAPIDPPQANPVRAVGVSTSTTPGALLRARIRLLGYDAFISYAHSDGLGYAMALENRLASAGYTVFRDAREMPLGANVESNIQRGLQRSRMLIVVDTSGARHSGFVAKELRDFEAMHGDRRAIIDLDVGASGPLWDTVQRRVFVRETREAIDNLQPSDEVVAKIDESRRFRLVSTVARWIERTIIFVVLAALAVAVSQYLSARRARDEAIAARDDAEKARDDAQAARDDAREQRDEAVRAAEREREARETAEIEGLVRESQAVGEHRVDRALAIALQAVARREDSLTRGQLLRALDRLENVNRIVEVGPHGINDVIFSADGRHVYTVDQGYVLSSFHTAAFEKDASITLPSVAKPHGMLTSGANSIPYSGAVRICWGTPERLIIVGQYGEIFEVAARGLDLESPRMLYRNPAPLLSLACDGSGIVFVGDDAGMLTELRVEPAGVRRVRSWAAHAGPVYAVALSPTMVATGGGDGTASVRRRVDGRVLKRWRAEHNGPYYAAEFADDGALLALSGDHGKVFVVNPKTGKESLEAQVQDRVLDMDFEHEASLFAIATDNEARVYDVKRGRVAATLSGHTEPTREGEFRQLTSIAFGPDGRHLVTGGQDGKLFVRSLPHHQFGPDFFDLHEVARLPALAEYIDAFEPRLLLVGALPDERLLMHDEKTVFTYGVDGRALHTLTSAEDSPVVDAEFDREGDRVIVARQNGRIELLRLDNGATRTVVQAVVGAFSLSAVASLRGGAIATVTADGRVAKLEEGISMPLCSLGSAAHTIGNDPLRNASWISVDEPRGLARCDLRSRDPILRFPTKHDFPISHLVFTASDGLAAASTSGSVTFWNIGNTVGEHGEKVRAHEYAIEGLVASEEENLVVSLDETKMCFWQADIRQLVGCLEVAAADGLALDHGGDWIYVLTGHFLERVPARPRDWIARAAAILGAGVPSASH